MNINEAMQRPVEASTTQWQQASEQLAHSRENAQQQEQQRTAGGPGLA